LTCELPEKKKRGRKRKTELEDIGLFKRNSIPLFDKYSTPSTLLPGSGF
jgi:hypothetical protein